MKEKNEMNFETDVKQEILFIQGKIDEELNKPENEIDMNLIDEYFKQIRELDGGVYEKSDEQIARELQNIYSKAAIKKKKCILWYLNTTGKRVAAIFIVIGLFFGLSFGVCAVRKPIIEFFLNVKEKFAEVFFDQEDAEQASQTIETVYTLGYVPEGYELSTSSITKYKADFVWQNQNGEYINFTQSILLGASTMDIEYSNYEIIYINDMKVAYSEKHGTTIYLWNTNEYKYFLVFSNDSLNENCSKLIESITEYHH